jgi:uncharacterized protein YbjT (DUF2867 family)
MRTNVFITGGTGYIGQRLIPTLIARGHRVRALVRPGSELRVSMGATPIIGDAFDRKSYAWALGPDTVVVHLIGTPKPSPAKAAQFEAVDFAAARECIAAAGEAGVQHFVYVSVAQPAPMMHAYIDVRCRVEQLLAGSGVSHTVLRPWYVLGPGHRWPHLLLPLYWIAGALPSTRDSAERLGLVTLPQMLSALTWSVETAHGASRLLEVRDIRKHRDADLGIAQNYI